MLNEQRAADLLERLDQFVPHERVDILRTPAGFGKIAVLQELEHQLQSSPDRTVYIGDGSSDLYVMHHVNSRDGYTVAVSESKSIGRIAKRSVLSESALSVLVPILEDLLHWDGRQIRQLFARHGVTLADWDKVRTDWLSFHPRADDDLPALALAP